jgi:arylsulfatase A-like enzyme
MVRAAGTISRLRKAILLSILSLSGGGLLVSCGSPPPRPNVVILLLDTFRADAIGAAGANGSVTPHLDQIAREGAVFVNAFSTAPWTVPSHASLFTGQYPYQHGAVHGRYVLVPAARTLAEVLQEQGYATAGFTCNSSSRFWCAIRPR